VEYSFFSCFLLEYLYADQYMSIKNTTHKKKFSQLRHSLRRLSDEVRELINPFFSDKPVIKGSVYELKTKCGKPGCKCAKGELHHRMVVSASEKGKTKLRAIPHGFLVEVQTKVRRYQELRRVRVRLIEVHKKMLQTMDEMEAMRREEMPVSRKKPTSQ
jgi:hypothetical protein